MDRNIVSIIEDTACDYFDYISASPFDTDAKSFWEHIGYIEDVNGNMVKDLKKIKRG